MTRDGSSRDPRSKSGAGLYRRRMPLGGMLCVCMAVGMVSSVWAQENPSPGGEAPPTLSDPWDPAHTRRMRNPFVPPGYVLPEAARTDPGSRGSQENIDGLWAAAEASLAVRGISRMDGEVVALIGRQAVSVGDILETEFRGRRFRWRVEQVDMQSGVQLERLY